jgi:tetratricopeptide (TPR) repeat protein
MTAQNIAWAFTSIEAANWHPVTWLSHMADVEFYGLNPRGHHLTNVAIHAIAALLLFLLLVRMTAALEQSLFVAALFALHPLHVESVAWLAERKDVLSAVLWFVTLLFYVEFAATRKRSMYLLALIAFMLGLMSKPMLVTLPLIMLLVDFCPFGSDRNQSHEPDSHRYRGNAKALVSEKIPFFICSLCSIVITIYAQIHGGATSTLSQVSLWLRVENALIAYVAYIGKTLWPQNLAIFYPYRLAIPFWQAAGALLALFLLSVVSVKTWRRHSYLAFGWLWFLITLIPVIGLVQVGAQSMADRYTYIPVIGLFIMAAWGAPELLNGFRHRRGILALFSAITLIASAAMSARQLVYWHDNISVYRRAVQVTYDNYLMHNDLGAALFDAGQVNDAISEYRESLRINPYYFRAHFNMGLALQTKGDLTAALPEYREAVRLRPNYAAAHFRLGNVLMKSGYPDEAAQEFRLLLRLNPDDMNAHYNLGLAFSRTGKLDAAIEEYRQALRLSPNNANVRYSLTLALARQKEHIDAGK